METSKTPSSLPRSSLRRTADGREVTSGPVGIDGLVYTRKIFSPLTGGFVRYLEVFTNPTATDITVSAKIEHYTWARSDARVVVSPAANGNHYAVMDSRLGQALSTAFVMGGPGARAPVTFARFVNGNDYHYFNWRMTVPAGQTSANFAVSTSSVSSPTSEPSSTRGPRDAAEFRSAHRVKPPPSNSAAACRRSELSSHAGDQASPSP